MTHVDKDHVGEGKLFRLVQDSPNHSYFISRDIVCRKCFLTKTEGEHLLNEVHFEMEKTQQYNFPKTASKVRHF